MFKKTALFITAMSLINCGTALANDKRFYLEVKGGLSKPRKLTDGFSDFKIKNSPRYEVSAGRNLNDLISVSASIGGSKNKINFNSRSTSIDANMTHNSKINSYYFMLDSTLYPLEIGIVSPFISAGIGLVKNKASDVIVKIDRDTTTGESTPGNYNFFKRNIGASTNNFSWRISAGLKFNISNDFDLIANYSFHKLGKIKSAGRLIYFDGETEKEAIETSKLSAHNFMLGLRYSF
jgi:opacity protein-like surface antigen